MALISNIGLGSGLDITSLVNQLVAAERAGPDLILNRREARANAQISAIGKVKSAFASLQTAVDKLRTGNVFEARKASSDATDRIGVSISAGQSPALGSFDLEVESLAAAQKLQSDPTLVTDGEAALATGTLSFSVDGDSFDVVVGADTTIYDLASSINQSSGGKVQAAVVNGDDGFSLSLTSGITGSAGEISISQTVGTGLEAFTFDPNSPQPGTLSESTPASDAVFYIDGVKRTSSSNSINDAISGLDLTLKQAELGVTVKLTVSEDSSSASGAVQGFVTAYNNVLKTLDDVSAYDPEANTAQALNGDIFVRSARSQLRSYIGGALNAANEAGVNLAINTQVDGTLTFNATTFSQNLAANPSAVKSLYSGEDAALTQNLSSYLGDVLANDGVLTQRNDALTRSLDLVAKDRETLERRLESIEERYRKQFIALDSLVAQLNSTSQFLAQQLQGLASSNS
ncbi:flagellar filament capping protein FliD [Pseudomarimonas arenosa]|uniref:Flagellar hook-associated protein 2 n=1 Tax=Pseudomarimonas arenosa TaxID=2774145 RepID=A0AAW3ZH40_9GAMM|nr:flagellar filament capping protein FliD [Pseudomarimonas arenosa]MBD8524750.1 flagellar filament capping protein FliD [Pseudomarimonas arenosa]